MEAVTLSIASRDDVSRRDAAALRGKGQGAHISFESVAVALENADQKAVGDPAGDDRRRRVVDPRSRAPGRP